MVFVDMLLMISCLHETLMGYMILCVYGQSSVYTGRRTAMQSASVDVRRSYIYHQGNIEFNPLASTSRQKFFASFLRDRAMAE